MYAEFRHLDGACAGQVCVVRKEFATIGRHPSADVPFDPQRDLDVSGRHAAVFRQGDGWAVRDLGSTNGTYVNGSRLKADRTLAANDILRFGVAGPQLAFQPREGEPATVPSTREESPGVRPERGERARRPTTERIRLEVRRQTTPWKRATLVVGGVAVLAIAAVVATEMQKHRALAAERAQLLARSDSQMARLRAASSGARALQAALEQARSETERLRASIAARGVTAERMDSLTRELATSIDRHQAMVRAAEFDAAAIAKDQSDAVAVVVSELPDGRRVAGTGFAVRVRGDTGWIATSRHLVADSSGRNARRLGVIFNRSSQNFRAEIAATADSTDLALLTVRIRGGMPTVKGLGAGDLRPGDPVAVLGFPFGLDFPMGGDWQKTGVRASSLTGTIRRVRTDMLEVDGYGVSGSSGSPVFNAAGEVVGVVYGGPAESVGRIVYAVPARAVGDLLRKAGAP